MSLTNIIRRNRFLIFGSITLAASITGSIWTRTDPNHHPAFLLWFFGWISFLLVVGYFSTPSNSAFGKVAFGFVVVMVIGIVIKILHMPGGNLTIIVALVGISTTYLIMWLRKRK